ncbi:unnamed protein product [Nyctereutes procyonoides]|uniref:(raccoon dog) hypothetical protein n=1 Tax=Nyctereutes procyonoides TaxID=34880 RepID=A0A811ZQ62_NYCPR|nr:unnamed protein product [Nyctereutes procyonoides]
MGEKQISILSHMLIVVLLICGWPSFYYAEQTLLHNILSR